MNKNIIYPKDFNFKAKSENTALKYSVYTSEDFESRISFMMDDIVGLCKYINFIPEKIIEINSLYVDKTDRENNLGNLMFKRLILNEEIYSKPVILLLRSSPLIIDYPEEPELEEYNKELVRQATYIECYLNMRNINSLCGFENSIPYILPTNKISPVMKAIIEREVTHPFNRLGGSIPIEK